MSNLLGNVFGGSFGSGDLEGLLCFVVVVLLVVVLIKKL